MRYLTLPEVLTLHDRIITTTGGSPGIRDLSALESALGQLQATFLKSGVGAYKCRSILKLDRHILDFRCGSYQSSGTNISRTIAKIGQEVSVVAYCPVTFSHSIIYAVTFSSLAAEQLRPEGFLKGQGEAVKKLTRGFR